MKKIFCFALLAFACFCSSAQVAINAANAAPHISAMLDITATDKGLLVPRMSTAERIAIASPAKGLLVFTNDDGAFWYHNGTQWTDLVNSASSIWKRNGNDAYASNTGNVVVGTTTPHPDARFHVYVGNNTTQGFLVTGNPDPFGSSVPSLGAGARLMFYPAKAAFRAGAVDDTQWDNSLVGENSVAMGFNTIAVGGYATAMGVNTMASGVSATAMGYQTEATNNYATAMGYSTKAYGLISTALGSGTAAHTLASTTMGLNTVARGFASTVTGVYNDSLYTISEGGISDGSPLFIVGNGDASVRSNALVVSKDGRLWIDPNNKNSGTPTANALMFGTYQGTGEAIASKRTAGVNQNGLDFYTGAISRLSITSAGDVGIGTATPSAKLHVVGNICATGTIGACSDIRYKTNLTPVTNGLSAVLALHPIYYHWKKEFSDKGFTTERQIGFSAQEIESHFPEMVQTDSRGYKAVDYSRLTAVLVEAVQEQQKQIDGLKAENEELKRLKEEVAEIKALLKRQRQ